MNDPLVIFFGLMAVASLGAIVSPFVRDWLGNRRGVLDVFTDEPVKPVDPPAVYTNRSDAFELLERLRRFYADDPRGLELINEAGKRLFDSEKGST